MPSKIVIDNTSGSIAVDGSVKTAPPATTPGATLVSNASGGWTEYTGGMSWRNKITNGDMAVSQRNGDAFVSPTPAGVYTVDRWRASQDIDSSSSSVYFDGNGDYLSIPYNAALDFGSGNFTIETWMYLAADSAADGSGNRNAGIVGSYNGTGQGWYIYVTGNASTTGIGLDFAIWNSGVNTPFSAAFTVQKSAWHHIALVRNNGIVKLFFNGVQQGTDATITANLSSNQPILIGAVNFGSLTRYINGNISNLRVVKGTALYTTNFTPSTVPLTAITNTSLLTCASTTFRDLSTNNFTVTPNGNAAVNALQPFGNAWSNYFDGSGDYLQTPNATNGGALQLGTSDFTIEFWINAAPQTGYVRIIDTKTYNNANYGFDIQCNNSAGSQPISFAIYRGANIDYAGISLLNVLNSTWNHIAFIRSGDVVSGYVNGIYQAQFALNSNNRNLNYTTSIVIGAFIDSTTGYVGSYYTGYISNLRIVKGTALYTTNFTPPSRSAPLTAVTNTSLLTCASNRFQDLSANNFTLTPAGNVAVSSASPIVGNKLTATVGRETGYSAYFDGSGDYLSVANNAALQFGTGDFTIECWFNLAGDSNSNIPTVANGGTKTAYLFTSINQAGAKELFCYVEGNASTTGTGLLFSWYLSGAYYTTSVNLTVSKNTWHHFAVSRSSSTLRMFFNGTQVASNPMAVDCSPNATYTIGGHATSAGWQNYLNGYISNFRIVKGTALYTANFTPSTATPLVPVSGTSLLACASSTFADKSSNNFTVTPVGNSAVSAINPFTQAGFGRSLRWAVSTPGAPIASQSALIQQRIEGANVYDLAWGGAGARAATLSFWVNSPVAGTFCAAIQNSGRDRSYVAEYTVSAANTWERKTLTIPGDSSGTWLTDGGVGMRVTFDMGSGTDFNTTAGAWQAGNFTRASAATGFSSNFIASPNLTNNFYVTGIQLEAGGVATPFEILPYGKQLELCQRYFSRLSSHSGQNYVAFGSGVCNTDAQSHMYIKYPVTMRAAPTITQSNTAQYDTGVRATTGIAAQYVGSDTATVVLNRSSAAGTTGMGSVWTGNNTSAAYVDIDAEL